MPKRAYAISRAEEQWRRVKERNGESGNIQNMLNILSSIHFTISDIGIELSEVEEFLSNHWMYEEPIICETEEKFQKIFMHFCKTYKKPLGIKAQTSHCNYL